MIVKIAPAGTASLEEPENFKAFKLVCAAAPESVAIPAEVGRLDGDHAWIDPAWLKAHGHPDDPAWLQGFEKMAAYAKGAGWVDAAGHIRAHIERM